MALSDKYSSKGPSKGRPVGTSHEGFKAVEAEQQRRRTENKPFTTDAAKDIFPADGKRGGKQ